MKSYTQYKNTLEKKREQKEFLQLRYLEDKEGVQGLHFRTLDFLGLSQHPYVKKKTIKYILEWGAGTTSSRLVREHLECHRGVEEKLASLLGKEAGLLFPSSQQVHQQILSTLACNRTFFFVDRYCHHGLIQAALGSGAQVFRYEHGDLEELSNLLRDVPSGINKWIISESLFAINGETIDLKHLTDIGEEYGAFTYIDDSMSVGMAGKYGMGMASHRSGIDLIFGSFGKQSGTFGAYIGTSSLFRDYLLAFSPQLAESTTLPPAGLGAISAALDLIPDMQIEREKVTHLSETLRRQLIEDHWDVGNGSSHLIPLCSLSEETCQKYSEALSKKGIYVSFLCPPFVPQGAARLCLSVNALHTQEDLLFLTEALKSIREEPSLTVV